MRKALILAALLVLMGNGNPTCPRDGEQAWFTGRTRIPNDPPYEMLYQYECYTWQHKFWSVNAPGTVADND